MKSSWLCQVNQKGYAKPFADPMDTWYLQAPLPTDRAAQEQERVQGRGRDSHGKAGARGSRG